MFGEVLFPNNADDAVIKFIDLDGMLQGVLVREETIGETRGDDTNVFLLNFIEIKRLRVFEMFEMNPLEIFVLLLN